MNEEERLNRNTNNILEMVNRTISEGDAGLVRKLIYEYRNKNYDLKEEIERLNNIIKKVEECIDYYAIENEDFSKFYNNEEMEILKIIGSDK